jgi:endonuclease YncB( thermonuclease family)
MRTLLIAMVVALSAISCQTKAQVTSSNEVANAKVIKGDTVKIANDEIEYAVYIIDPGFTHWLQSRSFPRGYHSETFLENKNRWYVEEWNRRVLQPQRYDSKLYEMQINYDPRIHYGYEVNYLIYNYMVYFQNTYKQNLFGIVPTR